MIETRCRATNRRSQNGTLVHEFHQEAEILFAEGIQPISYIIASLF